MEIRDKIADTILLDYPCVDDGDGTCDACLDTCKKIADAILAIEHPSKRIDEVMDIEVNGNQLKGGGMCRRPATIGDWVGDE